MPIVVTFDLDKPESTELNRIQGMFERLGWEHLGNTAYRYPALDSEHPTEDWFNHVIPALMLLRTYVRFAAADGRGMKKFSIDVQSTTGYNPSTDYGTLPLGADDVTFYDPSTSHSKAFGKNNLEEWIDSIRWPYAS